MDTKRMFLILGAAFVIFALAFWGMSVGWYNEANKLENTTKAQWKQNQNSYDAFWKTVKETAQVPDKYKDDLKEVLVSETGAKFGDGGSKAMFQWFQDRNINFDASLYKKIQDVIESGRADFKREQQTLADKQRRYQDHLGSYMGGFWADWHNFPREVHGEVAPPSDADGDGLLTVLDYPIVTSARTKAAFAAGEDEALDVFGN